MDIRFTSTLTPEDENQLVPAVLQALSGLLDLLPITYVLQVETSDLQTYQHGNLLEQQPSNPPTLES